MRTIIRIVFYSIFIILPVAGCSDGPDVEQTAITFNSPIDTAVDSAFIPAANDLNDLDAFYDQDGYEIADVIRIDIRTETVAGVCTQEDQSGCTLADVIADTNNKDEFKVEIPVHFKSRDFADDGSISNATLRQRGNSARMGPQKSFRIKLDSNEKLWRNERRLQLNKHPFDSTRIKNKLSFDLLRTLPYIPSLRTQFVNLWIDDGQGPVDYGLFSHVEFAGKEYLQNRELDKDDNLYKVEFFTFSEDDLLALRVDELGQPINVKLFETRLKIERGENHSKLVEMLEAVNDPDRSFDSVLDQYFNRNNVLMWITVNILMHQIDAMTQNFYLYNPKGSDTFYFLPWDYDGTFEPEQFPLNSNDNSVLALRRIYGYSKALQSTFVNQYVRQAGVHQRIIQAANEIRSSYMSDAQIIERANNLNVLAEPYLTRLPDSQHGRFEPRNAELFINAVSHNHDSLLNNYGVLIPPTLQAPEFTPDGNLVLSWTPAYDVTADYSITYDLVLSTSYVFEAENIVRLDLGIADAHDLIEHTVDVSGLPSGRLFARLTARGSIDPTRFWQIASNAYRLEDGTDRFGIQEITIP